MNYRKYKRWLVAYCRAHHIAIPKGLRVTRNVWGKYATQLTKKVQTREGLPVTGKPDAATIAVIKPFRTKLVQTALAELGTHEWPPSSNSGEVLKYLKAAGIPYASPWCAAFVTWCMKHAGWRRTLPSVPGYVPSWDTWGKGRGYEIGKYRAGKGDIVTFDWDGGDTDHIGIVLANYGPYKTVATVEGNVGAYGGSVTKRSRYWRNVAHVYRLPQYP